MPRTCSSSHRSYSSPHYIVLGLVLLVLLFSTMVRAEDPIAVVNVPEGSEKNSVSDDPVKAFETTPSIENWDKLPEAERTAARLNTIKDEQMDGKDGADSFATSLSDGFNKLKSPQEKQKYLEIIAGKIDADKSAGNDGSARSSRYDTFAGNFLRDHPDTLDYTKPEQAALAERYFIRDTPQGAEEFVQRAPLAAQRFISSITKTDFVIEGIGSDMKDPAHPNKPPKAAAYAGQLTMTRTKDSKEWSITNPPAEAVITSTSTFPPGTKISAVNTALGGFKVDDGNKGSITLSATNPSSTGPMQVTTAKQTNPETGIESTSLSLTTSGGATISVPLGTGRQLAIGTEHVLATNADGSKKMIPTGLILHDGDKSIVVGDADPSTKYNYDPKTSVAEVKYVVRKDGQEIPRTITAKLGENGRFEFISPNQARISLKGATGNDFASDTMEGIVNFENARVVTTQGSNVVWASSEAKGTMIFTSNPNERDTELINSFITKTRYDGKSARLVQKVNELTATGGLLDRIETLADSPVENRGDLKKDLASLSAEITQLAVEAHLQGITVSGQTGPEGIFSIEHRISKEAQALLLADYLTGGKVQKIWNNELLLWAGVSGPGRDVFDKLEPISSQLNFLDNGVDGQQNVRNALKQTLSQAKLDLKIKKDIDPKTIVIANLHEPYVHGLAEGDKSLEVGWGTGLHQGGVGKMLSSGSKPSNEDLVPGVIHTSQRAVLLRASVMLGGVGTSTNAGGSNPPDVTLTTHSDSKVQIKEGYEMPLQGKWVDGRWTPGSDDRSQIQTRETTYAPKAELRERQATDRAGNLIFNTDKSPRMEQYKALAVEVTGNRANPGTIANTHMRDPFSAKSETMAIGLNNGKATLGYTVTKGDTVLRTEGTGNLKLGSDPSGRTVLLLERAGITGSYEAGTATKTSFQTVGGLVEFSMLGINKGIDKGFMAHFESSLDADTDIVRRLKKQYYAEKTPEWATGGGTSATFEHSLGDTLLKVGGDEGAFNARASVTIAGTESGTAVNFNLDQVGKAGAALYEKDDSGRYTKKAGGAVLIDNLAVGGTYASTAKGDRFEIRSALDLSTAEVGAYPYIGHVPSEYRLPDGTLVTIPRPLALDKVHFTGNFLEGRDDSVAGDVIAGRTLWLGFKKTPDGSKQVIDTQLDLHFLEKDIRTVARGHATLVDEEGASASFDINQKLVMKKGPGGTIIPTAEGRAKISLSDVRLPVDLGSLQDKSAKSDRRISGALDFDIVDNGNIHLETRDTEGVPANKYTITKQGPSGREEVGGATIGHLTLDYNRKQAVTDLKAKAVQIWDRELGHANAESAASIDTIDLLYEKGIVKKIDATYRGKVRIPIEDPLIIDAVGQVRVHEEGKGVDTADASGKPVTSRRDYTFTLNKGTSKDHPFESVTVSGKDKEFLYVREIQDEGIKVALSTYKDIAQKSEEMTVALEKLVAGQGTRLLGNDFTGTVESLTLTQKTKPSGEGTMKDTTVNFDFKSKPGHWYTFPASLIPETLRVTTGDIAGTLTLREEGTGKTLKTKSFEFVQTPDKTGEARVELLRDGKLQTVVLDTDLPNGGLRGMEIRGLDELKRIKLNVESMIGKTLGGEADLKNLNFDFNADTGKPTAVSFSDATIKGIDPASISGGKSVQISGKNVGLELVAKPGQELTIKLDAKTGTVQLHKDKELLLDGTRGNIELFTKDWATLEGAFDKTKERAEKILKRNENGVGKITSVSLEAVDSDLHGNVKFDKVRIPGLNNVLNNVIPDDLREKLDLNGQNEFSKFAGNLGMKDGVMRIQQEGTAVIALVNDKNEPLWKGNVQKLDALLDLDNELKNVRVTAETTLRDKLGIETQETTTQGTGLNINLKNFELRNGEVVAVSADTTLYSDRLDLFGAKREEGQTVIGRLLVEAAKRGKEPGMLSIGADLKGVLLDKDRNSIAVGDIQAAGEYVEGLNSGFLRQGKVRVGMIDLELLQKQLMNDPSLTSKQQLSAEARAAVNEYLVGKQFAKLEKDAKGKSFIDHYTTIDGQIVKSFSTNIEFGDKLDFSEGPVVTLEEGTRADARRQEITEQGINAPGAFISLADNTLRINTISKLELMSPGFSLQGTIGDTTGNAGELNWNTGEFSLNKLNAIVRIADENDLRKWLDELDKGGQEQVKVLTGKLESSFLRGNYLKVIDSWNAAVEESPEVQLEQALLKRIDQIDKTRLDKDSLVASGRTDTELARERTKLVEELRKIRLVAKKTSDITPLYPTPEVRWAEFGKALQNLQGSIKIGHPTQNDYVIMALLGDTADTPYARLHGTSILDEDSVSMGELPKDFYEKFKFPVRNPSLLNRQLGQGLTPAMHSLLSIGLEEERGEFKFDGFITGQTFRFVSKREAVLPLFKGDAAKADAFLKNPTSALTNEARTELLKNEIVRSLPLDVQEQFIKAYFRSLRVAK